MSTPRSFTPSDDEAARLMGLRSVDALAAFAEPVFGEFVALAARLFLVPISLLSVVEEADAHYPANVGMAGHARQSRAEALCALAVNQRRTVVYRDLTQGANPEIPAAARRAAADNRIQFYAGALLRLSDQHPLGTLCLVDRVPRSFTPDEQHLLELLAGLVSRTLLVRHLCRERPDTGGAEWRQLSAELDEEIRALNALVRYLNARNGGQVPVHTTFLAQVEGRLRDLQGVLDAHQP